MYCLIHNQGTHLDAAMSRTRVHPSLLYRIWKKNVTELLGVDSLDECLTANLIGLLPGAGGDSESRPKTCSVKRSAQCREQPHS